jgi:hypothetical protein
MAYIRGKNIVTTFRSEKKKTRKKQLLKRGKKGIKL